LQGKARVSSDLAIRLADFCRLKKRESDYFLAMVAYSQAKTSEEKQLEFEKMAHISEAALHIVHADQYKFYDSWFYTAVWALLDIYPFQGEDYENLAASLRPTITSAQAKEALELLQKIGMIAKDQRGYYRPKQAVIDTGYRPPPEAVNPFVISMLEKARESLLASPPEERTLSWTTLTLSEKGYLEVLEELRNFRRRAMAIAEQNEADQVYHLNMQLFPLSEKLVPTPPSQALDSLNWSA